MLPKTTEGFKITSPEAGEMINKILLICFLAGLISGMLGVGGGIVIAPLMLELGVEPKVATSTSNFLLMFTASSGTILFLLSVRIDSFSDNSSLTMQSYWQLFAPLPPILVPFT